VLQPYTNVEDMRVADAARGCLLLLGELPDMAAKLALKSSLPEAVAPIMSIPLPRVSHVHGGQTSILHADGCLFELCLSHENAWTTELHQMHWRSASVVTAVGTPLALLDEAQQSREALKILTKLS
jgi:hypothetical protein